MLKEETIEKSHTGFWGRNDCEDRCLMALEKFSEFFDSPEHNEKCDMVLEIIKNFFPVKKAIYVNRRVGTKKSGPFTSIKVDNPVFPNGLSRKYKQEHYYEPLEKLGVQVVYNKATNSYLYHIR